MQSQEKLITYKEVSDLLGISRSTIYEWTREGKLPRPVKLGAGPKAPVKFKLSEVMAYIESLPTQCY